MHRGRDEHARALGLHLPHSPGGGQLPGGPHRVCSGRAGRGQRRCRRGLPSGRGALESRAPRNRAPRNRALRIRVAGSRQPRQLWLTALPPRGRVRGRPRRSRLQHGREGRRHDGDDAPGRARSVLMGARGSHAPGVPERPPERGVSPHVLWPRVQIRKRCPLLSPPDAPGGFPRRMAQHREGPRRGCSGSARSPVLAWQRKAEGRETVRRADVPASMDADAAGDRHGAVESLGRSSAGGFCRVLPVLVRDGAL